MAYWITIAANLAVIGFGISFLLFPDFLWNWTEYTNRSKGVTTSTRTPEWENSRFRIAWIQIILGCILLVFVVQAERSNNQVKQRLQHHQIEILPGIPTGQEHQGETTVIP